MEVSGKRFFGKHPYDIGKIKRFEGIDDAGNYNVKFQVPYVSENGKSTNVDITSQKMFGLNGQFTKESYPGTIFLTDDSFEDLVNLYSIKEAIRLKSLRGEWGDIIRKIHKDYHTDYENAPDFSHLIRRYVRKIRYRRYNNGKRFDFKGEKKDLEERLLPYLKNFDGSRKI